MPRGVRTDRISSRDLEVLGFIGRFGVVPRQAVSVWAGTARTVTQTRERRLRISGLVEVHPALGALGPFLTATRTGLRPCGLAQLRPATLGYGELVHSSACALLAAELEAAGQRLLSERQIAAQERLAERRIYSAELPGGSCHRPDLIRLTAEGPEAIEVELTAKGPRRLDLLLRAWRGAVIRRRVRRVLYLCSPGALAGLERAIARTATGGQLRAEALSEGIWSLP